MFPSKPFCVTVPNNFIGEPFTVALISGIEKIRIREGEYQKIPSKTFCLTVAKTSVLGNPQCFINFGYRKSLDKRGGRIKSFRRKLLVSQCRNFP